MSNSLKANLLDTSEGAVLLHRARLDLAPGRLAALASPLSPDERARAERFVLEVHRRRFTAARGLLRALLGQALGVPAETLRFEYGPQGKPALAAPHSRLRFNVSHSQDVGLFALSMRHELGVDVEAIRVETDAAGIAARFFSPAESAALLALPEPQRIPAFFRIWTRKEACVKLAGGGLHVPLDSFDVSLDEPARLLRADRGRGLPDGLALFTIEAPQGFQAALAVAPAPAAVRTVVV